MLSDVPEPVGPGQGGKEARNAAEQNEQEWFSNMWVTSVDDGMDEHDSHWMTTNQMVQTYSWPFCGYGYGKKGGRKHRFPYNRISDGSNIDADFFLYRGQDVNSFPPRSRPTYRNILEVRPEEDTEDDDMVGGRTGTRSGSGGPEGKQQGRGREEEDAGNVPQRVKTLKQYLAKQKAPFNPTLIHLTQGLPGSGINEHGSALHRTDKLGYRHMYEVRMFGGTKDSRTGKPRKYSRHLGMMAPGDEENLRRMKFYRRIAKYPSAGDGQAADRAEKAEMARQQALAV